MNAKTFSIAKLKAGLSSIVAEVARGGEVIITDHNRAVARLVPVYRVPPLPKVDVKAILELPSIRLPRGAKGSAQLIREIRDAK